jgi:hypothetical protein
MKLAIVGSRNFANLLDRHKTIEEVNSEITLAKSIIHDYCEIWYPDQIVSGGAPGSDTMGAQFAFEHGIDLVVHPAEWDKYGKRAGMVRNQLIVDDCDKALVFWDYRSPGTLSTINLLWGANKRALVYDFVNDEFHNIVPHRHELYEEKVLAAARKSY